jgi:hypothetical protein
MTRWIYTTLPLLSLMAGLAATPALADPRDDVMANLQRCAGFTDNHTWLSCYYGAAQPMRAQLGLSPAPDSQVSLINTAPVPAPPPMHSASTGSSSSSSSSSGWFSGVGDIFSLNTNKSSDGDFGAGTTRLASYSYGKDGLFTATLADGEVWTQSPYDDLRAHWSGQASSYAVIVSTDMFGSHTLKVKGDHDYRVMRTK